MGGLLERGWPRRQASVGGGACGGRWLEPERSRAVLQCAPYSSVGSDEGRGVIRKSAEPRQHSTAQDWETCPGGRREDAVTVCFGRGADDGECGSGRGRMAVWLGLAESDIAILVRSVSLATKKA